MKYIVLMSFLLLSFLLPQQSVACAMSDQQQEAATCEHTTSEKKNGAKHHCCEKDSKPIDKPTDGSAGCQGNGPCCCIIPMLSHLQINNFSFEFDVPSYTIKSLNTEFQQFTVSNGFSSIFIPPKIG